MEFSLKLYVHLGQDGPLYIIKGSQVIVSKYNAFLSQRVDFVLANSAEPDEMLHYAAFHLGLLCKHNPFRGFWSKKG